MLKMNNLLKSTIAVIALVGLTACDKFLDKMPDNRAEINSPEKIRALLTSAYSTGTYLFFSEYMSDNVDNMGDDNPGTNRYVDHSGKAAMRPSTTPTRPSRRSRNWPAARVNSTSPTSRRPD